MGFGKVLAGSLAVLGLAYFANSCVNSNKGYDAMGRGLDYGDKKMPSVVEFFDPGLDKIQELTGTTRVGYNDTHLRNNQSRLAELVHDGSGCAQLGALGAIFLYPFLAPFFRREDEGEIIKDDETGKITKKSYVK